MSSVAGHFGFSADAAGARGWTRDDRFAWVLTVMVWVLVVLMIVPEGFNYDETAVAPASGSALSRLLWLGLLALGVVIVIWRAALAWLLLKWSNPYLLLFVVLVAASVLWSIAPQFTIRRLIRLVTIMLDAAAFVLMGWHAHRFQRAVRPAITFMLFGSLAFGVAFPTLAIHQSTSPELINAWHGLTTQKNTLGAIACLGLILWYHAWLTRETHALNALACGGAALACLVLSRSSTSLMTAVFVMLFLTVLLRSPPNLRRYMPALLGGFVALLLVYSLAILRLVPGLETLLRPIQMITGKDLTFSNRSNIWAIIVDHIGLNPLLGTGYGAYWTGPYPDSPSYAFVVRMYFYPQSAHSGYLEIVNDLGVVGLFVLLGYLLTHFLQSLRLFQIDREQATLMLGLFLAQAIGNLTETHWLDVLSVDFLVMTLASFALSRALLDERLQAYFGHPLAAPMPPVPPIEQDTLDHGLER